MFKRKMKPFGFKPYFQECLTTLKFAGCWILDDNNLPKYYLVYFFGINFFFQGIVNFQMLLNLLLNTRSLKQLALVGYICNLCFIAPLKRALLL